LRFLFLSGILLNNIRRIGKFLEKEEILNNVYLVGKYPEKIISSKRGNIR